MDAQGRRQTDPADRWVLDPKTGTYRLRPDTSEQPDGAVTTPNDEPLVQDTAAAAAAHSAPAASGARSVRKAASRRKPKPKPSKKRRALVWTAGGVGFVLVAVSIGGYLVYQHFNNNINTVDVGDAGNKNATTDGPMNILVIGTDSRVGLGREYGDEGSVGHADTTILFHVAKDRSNATALSIPRDLITDIPDCPTRQPDGSAKVVPGEHKVRFNTSLGQEGRDPGCTMRTAEALTGLKIDHFMMANFNAVKDLSTAVGGVDVCLGKDVDDKGGSGLKLSRGHHTVEGEQALAFVRTRHSVGFGGDLDRIKLQQQFLSSLIRKMKSGGTLTDPQKLWKLADVATKALTVDTGIGSVKKLSDLAQDLSSVPPKNITFATVPVLDNPAEKVHTSVVLNNPSAKDLFQMVQADNSLTTVKPKSSATHAADPLQGPKAAPVDVRVNVLNGSGVFGAAQATLDWLQNTEGVTRSSNGGNAPGTVDKTTLGYAPNQADQARQLAAMMGLSAAALKQGTKDAAPRAPMTLTLGKDFSTPGRPLTAPTQAPSDVQHVQADQDVCAK
ncbi:LCP family protein [Streptantibioticus ferralitis]|uniref:LCP family protein n=1 Tax=Streptantibioticus ferralitis TaxID=236510 RepID=A0ABT5Z9A7_9ACTN|nr:LCP family protein [Streptantibioticus ferralitis]MDF2260389.1 LCP family protein [Streptantibioticus ferralitis]